MLSEVFWLTLCCRSSRTCSVHHTNRKTEHHVVSKTCCAAGKAALAVTGGLAIAVPLEMRGLEELHRRHGALPWSDLITPLVPVAEHGFPAHPYIVASLTSNFTLAVQSWRLFGGHPTCCTAASV